MIFYWVPLLYGLVPHLSKSICALRHISAKGFFNYYLIYFFIGCSFHMALCHILATGFLNYYLMIFLLGATFIWPCVTSKQKTSCFESHLCKRLCKLLLNIYFLFTKEVGLRHFFFSWGKKKKNKYDRWEDFSWRQIFDLNVL